MTILTTPIQDHLTAAPVDRFARQSYPGMAHFAGTGPHAKTCRECSFFDHSPYDYHAKNGKHHGLIKPARCKKHRQMTGAQGAKIPDDAAACRHFNQSDAAPERFAKS